MLTDKQRAQRHYPHNATLQAKWLCAVGYLRSKGLWVLEGGAAKWRAAA